MTTATFPQAAWSVRLVCCGRDEGRQGTLTWSSADEFRESYLSGYAVYPDSEWGHRRSAIITDAAPGQRVGWSDDGPIDLPPTVA